MQAARILTTLDYTRLDANGIPKRSTFRGTVRPEHITPAEAADARHVSDAITRMGASIATLAAFGLSPPLVVLGLAVDGSGTANIRIPHNLNAYVLWMVAGWRGNGNVAVPNLHDDRADATVLSDLNTLVLRSLNAGTVDLLLLAVPT